MAAYSVLLRKREARTDRSQVDEVGGGDRLHQEGQVSKEESTGNTYIYMIMIKLLFVHVLIAVSAGHLKNFAGYAGERPSVVEGKRKMQVARKKLAPHCRT